MMDFRRDDGLEARACTRRNVCERRKPADICETIRESTAERVVIRNDNRARPLACTRRDVFENRHVRRADALRSRERVHGKDELIRLLERHRRFLYAIGNAEQRLRVIVNLVETLALAMDARGRLLRIARNRDGRLADAFHSLRHLFRRLALAFGHAAELADNALDMRHVVRERLHGACRCARLLLDRREALAARAHPRRDRCRLRRDVLDDVLDFPRRLIALCRQFADFASDDGKPTPMLASTPPRSDFRFPRRSAAPCA